MLKVEESQGLYTFKFKPKSLGPLKKKKRSLKNREKKLTTFLNDGIQTNHVRKCTQYFKILF